MDKSYAILGITLILIVLIPTIASKRTESQTQTNVQQKNTDDDSNKQIIQMTVKGGYTPSIVYANAEKDSILRLNTNNTFDCSSSVAIPSLGVQKRLPITGSTEIALGSPSKGTKIDGSCSMGMYNFSIYFQ